MLNFLLTESFHLFLLTFHGPRFVLDFLRIISSPDRIIYVCPICHALLINQEGVVLLFANFCFCLCPECFIKEVDFTLNLVGIYAAIHKIFLID